MIAGTQLLVTLASGTLAVVCAVLLFDAYKRTNELLSPWTMFLAMALVDVYVPAALFFPVGLELPRWLSLLAKGVAMPAVIVFTLAAVFFAAGYFAAQRRGGCAAAAQEWKPSRARVLALALVIAGAYYLTLAWDVVAAGDVSEYLRRRLVARMAAPVEQPPLVSLLTSLRGLLLPTLFVLAGVAFAHRREWRVIGILVPLLALATATTTMFRGTVLAFFIGLAVIERARLHDLSDRADGSERTLVRSVNRRIIAVCGLGLLLFVAYGSLRNYMTDQAYSGTASATGAVAAETKRFVRGEGFVGLVAVLGAYPRDVEFMRGRTIRDMLLLPLPRAIWRDKPLWYGIDDITRAMGWPSSTQSAVTMPGELYANFAGWGLPLMGIYGALFGAMRAARFRPALRYVYAFVAVPMMLPTFWMGFTGFVNHLVPVPALLVALWFVFPKSGRGRS